MALITYLTRIQFDFGAIKLLPDEMKLAGITRPLLVTDKGVAAAGIAQRVADAMSPKPVATYDGTPSNPTERATKEALEIYRSQGCDGMSRGISRYTGRERASAASSTRAISAGARCASSSRARSTVSSSNSRHCESRWLR